MKVVLPGLFAKAVSIFRFIALPLASAATVVSSHLLYFVSEKTVSIAMASLALLLLGSIMWMARKKMRLRYWAAVPAAVAVAYALLPSGLLPDGIGAHLPFNGFDTLVFLGVSMVTVGCCFAGSTLALAKLRYEARRGDAHAQWRLGLRYGAGDGVGKNVVTGVYWFQKAVEQDHAGALFEMGKCYYDGEGLDDDRAQAVSCFLKAAEQGHAGAHYYMGLCCEEDTALDRHLAKAAAWFEKAAAKGHAEAQFRLGMCYKNGVGVHKSDKHAAENFAKVAAQGHAHAQFNLGLCYFHGHGVKADIAQAAAWFRLAARQKLLEAANYHKETAQSAKLYRKARKQGVNNKKEQYRLGMRYLNGDGTPMDTKRGAEWLRESASQGFAPAQYRLGLCYYNGEGAVQDRTLAVRWCRKAADQGYAIAQNALGECYRDGDGVTHNHNLAFVWFEKAARQNYPPAIHNLAICYENGDGVTEDNAKAHKLFTRAVRVGVKEAQAHLH
ncbi:MAG: hypothetical protein FWG50_01685 [Kiritimatiellaeota bacterium]|nr:hypothetical protein [Kiritimatiellota bacterium]